MFSRTAFRKLAMVTVPESIQSAAPVTKMINMPLLMSTATLLIAGGKWIGGVDTRLNNLEDSVKNFDTKLDKLLEKMK